MTQMKPICNATLTWNPGVPRFTQLNKIPQIVKVSLRKPVRFILMFLCEPFKSKLKQQFKHCITGKLKLTCIRSRAKPLHEYWSTLLHCTIWWIPLPTIVTLVRKYMNQAIQAKRHTRGFLLWVPLLSGTLSDYSVESGFKGNASKPSVSICSAYLWLQFPCLLNVTAPVFLESMEPGSISCCLIVRAARCDHGLSSWFGFKISQSLGIQKQFWKTDY